MAKMLVKLFTIIGRIIVPQVELDTTAPDFSLMGFRVHQAKLSDFREEIMLSWSLALKTK